jgi:hypothetical protein
VRSFVPNSHARSHRSSNRNALSQHALFAKDFRIDADFKFELPVPDDKIVQGPTEIQIEDSEEEGETVEEGKEMRTFKPGDIFTTFDYDDINFNNTGTTNYEKRRKFVVVSVTPNGKRRTALKLYTYNGYGLANKPDSFRDDHVGIEDCNNLNRQADAPLESNLGVIYGEKYLDFHKGFVKGKAYIKLSNISDFYIDQRTFVATIEGRILPDQMERLRRLVNRVIATMLWPDTETSETEAKLGAETPGS